MTTLRSLVLPVTLACLAGAPAAMADSIVGLVDGTSLVTFDAKTMAVTGTVPVSGVASLVGIDVRPADGLLYGVTPEGAVVTVDPATGATTPVVTLQSMLAAGTLATVDFNPAADKLRLIGNDGTNLRANLADGMVTADKSLAYAEGDMHKGETPNIVAGAYTNSVAGTKETALYDLDATIDGLIKQAPPNDGVLSAVGKLGVAADGAAFDIVSDGQGGNWAYLLSGGVLHTVDLASGKATAVGTIDGLSTVSDIAVLPR